MFKFQNIKVMSFFVLFFRLLLLKHPVILDHCLMMSLNLLCPVVYVVEKKLKKAKYEYNKRNEMMDDKKKKKKN